MVSIPIYRRNSIIIKKAMRPTSLPLLCLVSAFLRAGSLKASRQLIATASGNSHSKNKYEIDKTYENCWFLMMQSEESRKPPFNATSTDPAATDKDTSFEYVEQGRGKWSLARPPSSFPRGCWSECGVDTASTCKSGGVRGKTHPLYRQARWLTRCSLQRTAGSIHSSLR